MTELQSDSCFMELFAGEAGLTQAVSRLGVSVFEPGEVREGGSVAKGIDLLCNDTFKRIEGSLCTCSATEISAKARRS